MPSKSRKSASLWLSRTHLLALTSALLGGCAVELAQDEAAQDYEAGSEELASISLAAKAPTTIDIRRSLVVTELPILERFGFERVLNQLVDQADIPGLTALQLFQQMWDTRNPQPGLGLGPSCDSEVDPVFGPSINGFPFDCRPAPLEEGKQAACTSLSDPACAYIPIGLFNRFDLMPADGAHCGEHRIVYAKASGVNDSRDRTTIIFEAIMPNPHPQQGIKGCRKIIEAWAGLTGIDDMEERADRLEAFYFDGKGNIPPVVHIEHLGDNALGAGQIRTNEFVQPTELDARIWSLREFKLDKSCDSTGCSMKALPVTVKNNPFGQLFDANWADPRAALFQAQFVNSNVASLAASTLGGMSMSTADGFNSPQAHTSQSFENDYPFHFGAGGAFADAIQAKLTELGSTLTPANIVTRAQTQSCAGCHRLSDNDDLGGGLTWPASLGFVHVTERTPEVVDGVTRYRISPLLTELALPARKEAVEDFINNKPWKVRGNGKTLGGSDTH